MRTRLLLASAAALFAASPANAAAVFFPGAQPALPGSTLIADFDGLNGPISGVNNTDYVIQSNTDADGRIPAFNSSGNYLAVLRNRTVDFNFGTPVNNLSFAYGSADDYNTLTVFFNGGASSESFSGSQLIGMMATGSGTLASMNGLVYLFGYAGGISGIRLTTGENSFEIDNLRVNAVPEPGTWGMMLLGFGAVGYAMRRRKPRVVMQMA